MLRNIQRAVEATRTYFVTTYALSDCQLSALKATCYYRPQHSSWIGNLEKSTSSTTFHSSSFQAHQSSAIDDDPNAPTVDVTYIERTGEERCVKAKIGENLLELAHRKEIDLEGACEGSLACSTCHVIVEDRKYYDKLPEPEDDENDMLDLAFGLTETSRLGCQIKAGPELDGIKVRIPAASRNIGSEVS